MASPAKIVYHPKGTADEFFTFSDHATYQKWQHDRSIPLVNVVQKFEIYIHRGDVKGEPQRPTGGELE